MNLTSMTCSWCQWHSQSHWDSQSMTSVTSMTSMTITVNAPSMTVSLWKSGLQSNCLEGYGMATKRNCDSSWPTLSITGRWWHIAPTGGSWMFQPDVPMGLLGGGDPEGRMAQLRSDSSVQRVSIDTKTWDGSRQAGPGQDIPSLPGEAQSPSFGEKFCGLWIHSREEKFLAY